jgi:hypothetical protein
MLDFRSDRAQAGSRRTALHRGCAAGAIVGAVAALGLTPAASADVKSPRSIEVAHGRDLVIVSDYPKNTPVTVDVLRAGVVIATSTQYETDSDGFLELNHVGGEDCFDGGTAPDIRPGDMVRTTIRGDDVDFMVVQNVTYDGAPVERMRTVTTTTPNADPTLPDTEVTTVEGTGVFEVTGTALAADGVTPLAGDIEVRLNHPARRIWENTGRRDWRVTAQADANGRYVAAFDTNGSEADKAVIEDAEMAALWLGSTSELSGYDGPGSPCNPAPNAGITSVTPAVVNGAAQEITVNGFAPAGAGVTLNGVEVPVTAQGGWSATISALNLADGPFTVTAVIDGVPESRTIRVDRTTPAAPQADLPSGEYTLPQAIHLYGENEVHYTTDGSEPTKASPSATGPITLTTARTIKAIAVDAAGNVGPVATFSYTQKPARVVLPPVPEPVIVERPVEVIREVPVAAPPVEVIREVPIAAPPVETPVVIRPAARIESVVAPRTVKLSAARKGIRIVIATTAASIRVTASGGAKITALHRSAGGYVVRLRASRKGAYKVTVGLRSGATKVVTVKVR